MILLNGLQRSGTNFATSIFSNVTDCVHPYHKHSIRDETIPVNCHKVFCIIKNPYTWVESICFRNQVDIKKYFPFYKLHNEKDYLGPHHINLKELCRLYQDFYMSWITLDKTKLIHYEDLLIKYRRKNIPYNSDWDTARTKTYLKYNAPLVTQEAKNVITNTLGKEFFNLIGYPIKQYEY